jgi:hypothetical protein
MLASPIQASATLPLTRRASAATPAVAQARVRNRIRVRAEVLGRGGAPGSAEAAARVTLPLESLVLGAPAL